ncbi:MAG: hypothetical protein IRZ33_11310 [Alicyclobacillaceae bacterium]|nr:hypothetical protein [Alicyclobacillaceae bacterium]
MLDACVQGGGDGGKPSYLIRRIIARMAPHRVYVELFGGGPQTSRERLLRNYGAVQQTLF